MRAVYYLTGPIIEGIVGCLGSKMENVLFTVALLPFYEDIQ